MKILQDHPAPSVSALCRRRQGRQQVSSRTAWAWYKQAAPVPVTVIEADICGARLLFALPVQRHQLIQVSFCDELGFFQTREARVAWTETFGGKTIAGVAFHGCLTVAA